MSHSHQIGFLIRSCREARGISQDYMAESLNIAQSAYAYLESGKTTMSIDRLIRITEILDLDIHQIIDESIPLQQYTTDKSGEGRYSQKYLYPGTKKAYDMLIAELRSEVEFLRSLIKKE